MVRFAKGRYYKDKKPRKCIQFGPQLSFPFPFHVTVTVTKERRQPSGTPLCNIEERTGFPTQCIVDSKLCGLPVIGPIGVDDDKRKLKLANQNTTYAI